MCSSAAELENILAEIHGEAGGVTLHRICRAAAGVGSQFLEREGLRSMIGEHHTLEADAGGDCEDADAACVAPAAGGLLRLVTVNVDGLGEYDAPPSERMEA